VPGEHRSGIRSRRGFVIGELLVALLLLAVAVSSLAALMYSVSRRPEADQREPPACVAKNGKLPGNCVAHTTQSSASKLLRSGCVAKTGTAARGCNEQGAGFDSLNETVVKSRTDSASVAMVAKKQEAARVPRRPDRGFIR
jgi:Tfp pilus assembly protein PilV